MDTHGWRGFKLRDLMVAIAVIGIAVGLILPATTNHRGHFPRAQCANNMRQLGLALSGFQFQHGAYPNAATIFDDPAVHQGDPARSNLYRALVDPDSFRDDATPLLRNWVVDALPHLDQQDLAAAWDGERSYLHSTPSKASQPPNLVVTTTSMRLLTCPHDPTIVQGQGNLSYVVNGGFSRWPALPVSWSGGAKDGQPKNGGLLQWTAPGSTWQDAQAVGKRLGVMFLGTQTGDQPWDIRTRPSNITDGAGNTILVAENTLAGYSPGTKYSGGLPTNWACPLPNFCMFFGSDDVCHTKTSTTDCLGGQLALTPKGDGPGWARANRSKTFENINDGRRLTVEGSFPFANSGHSGGANFVFCDGSIRFLSDTIDGTVYAKLLTPSGAALDPALRQGPIFPIDFEK